jgi:hypothetical protein
MELIEFIPRMCEFIEDAEQRRIVHEHVTHSVAARSLWDDLDLYAAGGVCRPATGNAYCWLWIAPQLTERQVIALYRTLRAEAERIQQALKINLDCWIDPSQEAAERLVKHLGFEKHGIFFYLRENRPMQVYYRRAYRGT